MKKLMLKNLIIIVCLLIAIFLLETKVDATSFTVTSSVSVNVGKTATITINGKNTAGKYTITSSNPSVASVSTSAVFIDDNSASITVTGKSAGTAKITVTAADVGDFSNQLVTGSKTCTVTVKAATSTTSSSSGSSSNTSSKKSSNANLKTLGITPNDFSGFKPGTTSYNVTVPNNVSSVKVYATAADSKAKVSGTGNKSLKEGKNTASVTVTAEDGTKKTYTINITRKAAEEENTTTTDVTNVAPATNEDIENSDKKEEAVLSLLSLSISGVELSPEFNSDIYEYKTTIKGEDIKKLDIKAIPSIEDAEVKIEGNENLQLGDNIITITVSKNEEDMVVYQVKITKEVGETVEQNSESFIENNRNMIIAGLGVALVIVVAAIVFVAIKFPTAKDGGEVVDFSPLSDNQDTKRGKRFK